MPDRRCSGEVCCAIYLCAEASQEEAAPAVHPRQWKPEQGGLYRKPCSLGNVLSEAVGKCRSGVTALVEHVWRLNRGYVGGLDAVVGQGSPCSMSADGGVGRLGQTFHGSRVFLNTIAHNVSRMTCKYIRIPWCRTYQHSTAALYGTIVSR